MRNRCLDALLWFQKILLARFIVDRLAVINGRFVEELHRRLRILRSIPQRLNRRRSLEGLQSPFPQACFREFVAIVERTLILRQVHFDRLVRVHNLLRHLLDG